MSCQFVQTMSIQRQFIAPRMKVRRKRRARRLRFMLAPLLLFLTLLLQISVRVQIIERGYSREQLRADALRKDTELRQLKLDLALSTRPADLTRSAESRVGLKPVDPKLVRALLDKGEG